MLHKDLLQQIPYFPITIVYKSQLLPRNEILNNEWQRDKANPQLIHLFYDDKSSNFSHHSFFRLNGTLFEIKERFQDPLGIHAWIHRINIKHNNNRLCKDEFLCCNQVFSSFHHRLL